MPGPEALEQYRQELEADGVIVFRPDEWDARWSRGYNWEEAQFGHLLGSGCDYYFYARGDGNVVLTMRPHGPWPHAAVERVCEREITYTHAIIKVAVVDGISGGSYTDEEMAALCCKVLIDHAEAGHQASAVTSGP